MTKRGLGWFCRLLLVVVIALPATASAGAAAREAAPSTSLAGQFLVASPGMADPRFARTVVYMISHDAGGAMGLVLNRGLGQGSLRTLLHGFGVEPVEADGTVRLHYGGPVEQTRGFVLHSADYAGASTRIVADGLAVSTGFDVLRAVAAGGGPQRREFYLGYAGWGPGQLEGELARDDWLTAPADARLIFSDDLDAVWREALTRAGTAL